jgi:hypothetical protein
MNMKITDKILSIPPYISTVWENVHYIHMKGDDLIIALKDGGMIAIQGLTSEEIEIIFSAHATFLEKDGSAQKTQKEPQSKGNSVFEQLFNPSAQFKVAIGQGGDLLGQALAHNPAYADLPTLPQEVIKKISSLAKIVSPEDILALPAPEANCNCVYCQINRILRKEILQDSSLPDHPIFDEFQENIPEEDLLFDQWEIRAIADRMYAVINKLDSNEQYNVYLGEPIGCTCGKANCVHIIAVLKT